MLTNNLFINVIHFTAYHSNYCKYHPLISHQQLKTPEILQLTDLRDRYSELSDSSRRAKVSSRGK